MGLLVTVPSFLQEILKEGNSRPFRSLRLTYKHALFCAGIVYFALMIGRCPLPWLLPLFVDDTYSGVWMVNMSINASVVRASCSLWLLLTIGS